MPARGFYFSPATARCIGRGHALRQANYEMIALDDESKSNIGANAHNSVDSESELAGVFDTFPLLKERLDRLAGTISDGEQGALSMGCRLIAAPEIDYRRLFAVAR